MGDGGYATQGQSLPTQTKERPFFEGPLDRWWTHRSDLIARHKKWHDSPVLPSEGNSFPELFPPPGSLADLCVSSHWRPAEKVENVFVTAGGIYGGLEGPAGLFEALDAALPATSFLLLDTGHHLDVSVPVLRAGIKWVLSEHPNARIWLACFSMGSATSAIVGSEFLDHIDRILIFAGQTSQTEKFQLFKGKRAFIAHGEADVVVPCDCGRELAAMFKDADVDVALEIFPQTPPEKGDSQSRMRRHHLWDERRSLRNAVLAWLEGSGTPTSSKIPPPLDTSEAEGAASGTPKSTPGGAKASSPSAVARAQLLQVQTELLEVQEQLAAGGDDINSGDVDGISPLMWAAYRGRSEVCLALLGARADPTNKDKRGMTSLMHAAASQRPGLCPLLIAAKCDVNVQDLSGRTALLHAVDGSTGVTDTIAELLQQGANITHQDENGCSPLILASVNGVGNVAAVLLEHKADLSQKDSFGGRAIDYAKSEGHDDVLELLREASRAEIARRVCERKKQLFEDSTKVLQPDLPLAESDP